jgi:hypothetical protein
MKQELDKLLCEKYPKMMVNRNKSMIETCMCWGFECGDGWYNIIDILCGKLCSEYLGTKSRYDFIKDRVGEKMYGNASGDIITQGEIDLRKQLMDEEALKVPVASQVKEKFGGLRFYVQAATDKHYNFISFAESMSYRTCESCGAEGKTYTDGWHTTLCDIHAEMSGRTEEYEYEENE